MAVFPNPNSLRISRVPCENFLISLLEENCFSIIGKLEIERIRHAGNRHIRKTLGIVIPNETLLTKARLPAATSGKIGISPTVAKLCLKEIKMIGIIPAIKIRNMKGNSFECFSEKFIDLFKTHHRMINIAKVIVAPIEIFSPR